MKLWSKLKDIRYYLGNQARCDAARTKISGKLAVN